MKSKFVLLVTPLYFSFFRLLFSVFMFVCSFLLFEFILGLFVWPLKVVNKAEQKTKTKSILTLQWKWLFFWGQEAQTLIVQSHFSSRGDHFFPRYMMLDFGHLWSFLKGFKIRLHNKDRRLNKISQKCPVTFDTYAKLFWNVQNKQTVWWQHFLSLFSLPFEWILIVSKI